MEVTAFEVIFKVNRLIKSVSILKFYCLSFYVGTSEYKMQYSIENLSRAAFKILSNSINNNNQLTHEQNRWKNPQVNGAVFVV